MEHYIIDSLNVINKSSFFKSKFSISKSSAIAAFCDKVCVYAGKCPSYKFTIVVDGTEMPNNPPYPNIKLISSGAVRTADDKIKEIINNSHSKKNIVVVSSDREVYNYARANTCKAMESDAFIKLLFPQDAPKPNTKQFYEKSEKPSHSSRKDFEEFKRLFSESNDEI